MMNGYSSFTGAMQQSGPAAGQCRCQQRCTCQAGQPCRCSGGCTCTQSGAAQASLRARNWVEAGEREMRYPRAQFPRQARAYPPSRPGTGFAGYAAGYRPGFGAAFPGGYPRTYPQGYQRGRSAWLRARARNMLQQRLAYQQDWARRTRLNGMFARRFNWGPYLGRAASAIGSALQQPDSRRFMFALARWQQRQGLPVTGILTPSLWPRLLAAEPMAAAPQAPAMQSAMQPDMQPGMPPDMPTQPAMQTPAPDAAAGPGTEAAADDAALPLPGDAGEPDAVGNEYAVPRGFRSRHAYAY